MVYWMVLNVSKLMLKEHLVTILDSSTTNNIINIKVNIISAANNNHYIDEYMASRMKLDTHVNVNVVDRGEIVNLTRGYDTPNNATNLLKLESSTLKCELLPPLWARQCHINFNNRQSATSRSIINNNKIFNDMDGKLKRSYCN